ncbi:hypothetical protein DICPUDRAFT_94260 [Dictyostelium purpureum]|uniref:Uncharacterized protein n=1 Tax=Dictyostelium purpureum TaxID=5786 RepID=F0ZH90_DICPU|nr:uncharacterized protein DICPUDRAFT_94260 [Dictyostelium purpureum]EGC36682.1 hypothetical protein DICPUDRAFT_94260 [Dictyostelium purpureum]|eukprot:XP_003286781.1 hypothetical protein DICPUDRAFT_94260 [Dictyostelium purpureum]
MIRSSQIALSLLNSHHSSKVFQPVSLVLHGNQYLKDLSSNNLKNDIAKKSLESMNISFNENNNNIIINAKDWIDGLHNKGMGSLSLSRSIKRGKSCCSKNKLSSSTTTQLPTDATETEFVIVSSPLVDEYGDFSIDRNNQHSVQAWQFTKNDFNETLPRLSPSQIRNQKEMEEFLIWRKIALGDIRERIREAVERMRDFTILNFHSMDLSESQKSTFLNNLTEAEKFIHMDVMVSTKKDMDKLYDYLNLPREYASSAQSRVALQILNAAMSAYIFDSPTKISDPKLNEDFKKLTKELYESVLDSVICSTNYIE